MPPALALLPTQEDADASLQLAMEDMERRAALREELTKHLAFCPVCERNASRAIGVICLTAAGLVREALA